MPREAPKERSGAILLVQRRWNLFNEVAEDAPDKEKNEDSGDKKNSDNNENAYRTPKEFTELRFDHNVLLPSITLV